jgi:hypothetical protein
MTTERGSIEGSKRDTEKEVSDFMRSSESEGWMY